MILKFPAISFLILPVFLWHPTLLASVEASTPVIDSVLREILHKRKILEKNTVSLLSQERFWPDTTTPEQNESIIDISPSAEEYLIPLAGPFSKEKELILSFSPHHFHTFIIAGGLEFHTPIYPGKAFYRYVVDDSFRSGIFIRFKNIPPADLQKIQDYIRFMEGHKSELCLRGTLEVLARGADILAPRSDYLSLKFFLKDVIKKGFKKTSGIHVPVQIFKVSDHSLKDILKSVRRVELKYGFLGLMGALGAKIGRIRKNKSDLWLKENFYFHPQFPVRNIRKHPQ